MSDKELLFTVTAKDCEWDYIRGRGRGGQKKNKTSSAVRCRHGPSGALGFAQDSRKQSENRRLAFVRMAESKEFKQWHRIEVSRILGELVEIERKIDQDLKDPNVTNVEILNTDGKWVRWVYVNEKRS